MLAIIFLKYETYQISVLNTIQYSLVKICQQIYVKKINK